jgi:hypothetical protein
MCLCDIIEIFLVRYNRHFVSKHADGARFKLEPAEPAAADTCCGDYAQDADTSERKIAVASSAVVSEEKSAKQVVVGVRPGTMIPVLTAGERALKLAREGGWVAWTPPASSEPLDELANEDDVDEEAAKRRRLDPRD